MNVIQEIRRINERELEQGVSGKASWHHEYKDSAWVFAGGFPYDLTEGDILCVMSQWGEIEDINLCREKDTGKSKVLVEISGRMVHLEEEKRQATIVADSSTQLDLPRIHLAGVLRASVDLTVAVCQAAAARSTCTICLVVYLLPFPSLRSHQNSARTAVV